MARHPVGRATAAAIDRDAILQTFRHPVREYLIRRCKVFLCLTPNAYESCNTFSHKQTHREARQIDREKRGVRHRSSTKSGLQPGSAVGTMKQDLQFATVVSTHSPSRPRVEYKSSAGCKFYPEQVASSTIYGPNKRKCKHK